MSTAMSTAKPEGKRNEKNDKDELEKILGSMGISEHDDGLKGDLDVYVESTSSTNCHSTIVIM